MEKLLLFSRVLTSFAAPLTAENGESMKVFSYVLRSSIFLAFCLAFFHTLQPPGEHQKALSDRAGFSFRIFFGASVPSLTIPCSQPQNFADLGAFPRVFPTATPTSRLIYLFVLCKTRLPCRYFFLIFNNVRRIDRSWREDQ